jgi:hypothetical protein
MSVRRSVVYGPWQLRFDEPVASSELRCVDLGPHLHGAFSLILDLRGEGEASDLCRWDPKAGLGEGPRGLIPLAVIERDNDRIQITHLVCRLERHFYQFIRPPEQLPNAPASLSEQLVKLFRLNHLKLNNFECFYAPRALAPQVGRTLRLEGDVRETLADTMRDLESGRMLPFALQFGNGLQNWSYRFDATACDEPGATTALRVTAEVCRSRTKDSLRRYQSTYRIVPDEDCGEFVFNAVRTVDCGETGRTSPLPFNIVARVVCCESLNSGQIYQLVFSWTCLDLCAIPNASCAITVRHAIGRVDVDKPAISAEIQALVDYLLRTGVEARAVEIPADVAASRYLNIHGPWL